MSEKLSLQAQESRRDYKRRYRTKNREKINRQQREWRADNGDKVRQYNRQYWERRAQRENTRASYADYGITPERQKELAEIVKDDRYANIILEAAMKADRLAAGHIVLSVTKGRSYDHLEYDERLGRCPLGRTDFYGARRLFFHYLDIAMREEQQDGRQHK